MSTQRKKFYQIEWKESAIKSVEKFPKDVRQRIVEKVEKLSEDAFLGEALSGDLKGLRRIRIGDYRIIYFVNTVKGTVIIVKVGNRGDIYR
jgi:mRNA interferase RelE/StbE